MILSTTVGPFAMINKKKEMEIVVKIKKLFLFLLSTVIIASGCASNSSDVTSTTAAGSTASEEPKATAQPQSTKTEKPLTAAEVLGKSIEASAALDSFQNQMKMKQTIKDDTQQMEIQSDITMEIALKPKLAMHQVIKAKMEGNETNTETYLAEDSMYILEPTSGKWMKMPIDPSLLQSMQQNSEYLKKQLENFNAVANEITVSDKTDSYELKISASGDKLQSFVQEQIKSMMSGQNNALLNMDAMKISKMDMVYVIDKNTFLPKSYDIKMDFEMTIEQETISVNMDANATYEKINEIKEIKIPAEALAAQAIQ
jgi:hypothetical protein